MSSPVLIVLAAGRARRYGGLKPLAPVGVHGEAVIDLIASDAYAAGFAEVVLVINPDTGEEIRRHVEQNWPADRQPHYAIQDRPLGTVHAVLAARHVVDDLSPFAVANADDLYGRDAMLALGSHLRSKGSTCLIGFRLDRAVVGDQPVTRGVCKVRDGVLNSIVERRHVRHTPSGFIADDGLQPRSLDPDTRVSMNLWGFAPSMWQTFAKAMGEATDASEDAEVLLPVVVGEGVKHGEISVEVIEANSRCIGVTHPDDLELVRGDVADQVARGDRPERAFR